jgi:hypothetical protein
MTHERRSVHSQRFLSAALDEQCLARAERSALFVVASAVQGAGELSDSSRAVGTPRRSGSMIFVGCRLASRLS